ncbi:MAG: DEAD/DEAH box helicase, partial [Actinobacteria bacterium]|nr:DEAD/DEAH box helicase [Actinomycetota bacterium]
MINSVNAAKVASNVMPDNAYVSQHKFEDFQIHEQIKRNITNKNFTAPTPIQDQAIPAIMEGKDIIGIANTGTGKTVAFLIPLIDKVFKNRNEKVLIIAPTRELTLQINEEFNYFARGTGIKSALCIGGISTFGQKNTLRQNPNFIIGTPGRIKDFVQKKALHLSQFNNVVLDEADRMVDIGFIHEVKYFISLLPRERQSLFFSATVSGKVKEILDGFVKDPVMISVKQQDVTQNINQDIVKVLNKERKIDQLHNLLRQDGFHKILIFGRTKRGIQKLTDELIKRGFRA